MYKMLLSFNDHFLDQESGSLTQGRRPGLAGSDFDEDHSCVLFLFFHHLCPLIHILNRSLHHHGLQSARVALRQRDREDWISEKCYLQDMVSVVYRPAHLYAIRMLYQLWSAIQNMDIMLIKIWNIYEHFTILRHEGEELKDLRW